MPRSRIREERFSPLQMMIVIRNRTICALIEVFSEHRVGIVGGRVVLHDPTDARAIRDLE